MTGIMFAFSEHRSLPEKGAVLKQFVRKNIGPIIILITLACVLIGGIQMLMLGIVGEYIARIYIQGKGRPVYIEKEVLPPVDELPAETSEG